ncbi:MAG: hypothetical protein JO110_28820 [Acetobacteraceae bacterium]|nr:hypothetical protein [Acetobacteraceae bacterium]
MRKTLLMSAACLGLAVAAPAFAQTSQGQPSNPAPSGQMMQPSTGTESRATSPYAPPGASTTNANRGTGHQPGVGDSEPHATRASNINPSDTRTPIAPALPVPSGSENASPHDLLQTAQRALARGQTGLAQSAIERAQTNLLNSDEFRGMTHPTRDPRFSAVEQARQALGRHDVAAARQQLNRAIQQLGQAGSPGGATTSGGMSGTGTYNTGQGGGGAASPGTTGAPVVGTPSRPPGPGRSLGQPMTGATQQGTATSPSNSEGVGGPPATAPGPR